MSQTPRTRGRQTARAPEEDQSHSRSRSRSPVDSSTPRHAQQQGQTPVRGHKNTSSVWSHCTQISQNGTVVTKCNHCESKWVLSGSTSTALQHLKMQHLAKFSPEDLRKIWH